MVSGPAKPGEGEAGATMVANAGVSARAAASGEIDAEQIALPWEDLTGRALAAAQQNRKAGRPLASQSAAKIRAALLAGGYVPQLELRKWLQHGPVALARMLGCDSAKAFELWANYTDKLGRYTLAPLAPVDGEGRVAPTIAVIVGGGSGVVDQETGEARPPWEYTDLPPEQFQEVSAPADGESQDARSKDEKNE